jgi:hypothetical protein
MYVPTLEAQNIHHRRLARSAVNIIINTPLRPPSTDLYRNPERTTLSLWNISKVPSKY